MLKEAHLSAALNYFFFLLQDEGMALNAAFRAVKFVQRDLKKNPNESVDHLLIGSMAQVLRKIKDKRWSPLGHPPKSDWRVSNREALSSWKDFLRGGDLDFSETLVLRYILKFSVTDIAQGLSVPEGTVYFRIGRGLESYSNSLTVQKKRAK